MSKIWKTNGDEFVGSVESNPAQNWKVSTITPSLCASKVLCTKLVNREESSI